jgi:hypothetical protein
MPPAEPTRRRPAGPTNPPCPAPSALDLAKAPTVVRSLSRRSRPPNDGLPWPRIAGALLALGTGGPGGPTACHANGVAVLAEPPCGRNPDGPRRKPLIGLSPGRPPAKHWGTLDSAPAAVAPFRGIGPRFPTRPGRVSPGHGDVVVGRPLCVGPRKEGRDMPSRPRFVQGNKCKAARQRLPSVPWQLRYAPSSQGAPKRRPWAVECDAFGVVAEERRRRSIPQPRVAASAHPGRCGEGAEACCPRVPR